MEECIGHIFFSLIFLFLRERESVHAQTGGTERERGRERGSEVGSVLTAESLMQGSDSGTMRS